MFIALAVALTILSPPLQFDKGIPGDYRVEIVPFALVPLACTASGLHLLPLKRGELLLGCTNAPKHLIIIPVEDATFPYDHACWLMNVRHEAAHANGWGSLKDHPGGHTYVCSPK